jgi:hypothetical protein
MRWAAVGGRRPGRARRVPTALRNQRRDFARGPVGLPAGPRAGVHGVAEGAGARATSHRAAAPVPCSSSGVSAATTGGANCSLGVASPSVAGAGSSAPAPSSAAGSAACGASGSGSSVGAAATASGSGSVGVSLSSGSPSAGVISSPLRVSCRRQQPKPWGAVSGLARDITQGRTVRGARRNCRIS